MSSVKSIRTDRALIEALVRKSLERLLKGEQTRQTQRSPIAPRPLVANISARHCHLTQEDVYKLFGPGHQLTPMKYLYQEGEFAAKESVTIIGPRQRTIVGVRILGPCRSFTQVELAFTDGISLGIDLPVRRSGDHHDSPGCYMMGPAGMIQLDKGVIRAERHVHMSPSDADHYGVKPNDRINLRVHGNCPTILEGLLCRVDDKFKLEVHIDTDEGNACNLTQATKIELFR